jgi:hypothetical protein
MATISHKTDNIFEADVEALVNAVNCVGVMGRGIARRTHQSALRRELSHQAALAGEQSDRGDRGWPGGARRRDRCTRYSVDRDPVAGQRAWRTQLDRGPAAHRGRASRPVGFRSADLRAPSRPRLIGPCDTGAASPRLVARSPPGIVDQGNKKRRASLSRRAAPLYHRQLRTITSRPE